MKASPPIIKSLAPNQVFVFGSNEAGRHGRGAAFTAKKWGARNGKGFGLSGQTFAIPTKDKNIKTMPLRAIEWRVKEFMLFAAMSPENQFLVTEIGCGLAGYSPKDIAPMFRNAPANVLLPQRFIDVLSIPE